MARINADKWHNLEHSTGLEGDLRTLELRDAALALVHTTPTATAETTTASTTTTATAATTATTAKAATAALAIAGTRGAEVQAEGATLELLAIEVTVSLASLINRRVLNVAEALGTAGFGVSGETDAHDAALLGEEVTEGILGSAEGQVANEQSVTLGAGLITEVAGTSLSTVTATLLVLGLTSSSVVQVDGTAVNLGALLGLEGLGGISGVGVLDVAETRYTISIMYMTENPRV